MATTTRPTGPKCHTFWDYQNIFINCTQVFQREAIEGIQTNHGQTRDELYRQALPVVKSWRTNRMPEVLLRPCDARYDADRSQRSSATIWPPPGLSAG